MSDLTEPENRFERDQGKLLEAYTRVEAPDGQPLLFEAYQQFSSVTSSGRSLWLAFAPALIVGADPARADPAAARLIAGATGSRRAPRPPAPARARGRLLRPRAPSHRRRPSRRDGPGPRRRRPLAGGSRAPDLDDTDAASAGVLRQGAESMRGSVRSLRSLLVEIYPPSLQQAGLDAALANLLAPLEARGIDDEHRPRRRRRADRGRGRLAYRVAQESVRNAARHAARPVTSRSGSRRSTGVPR